MYKKIVVPLDRSVGAESALGVAADFATANGGMIRLLHVAQNPGAVVVDGRVVAYADQEAERVQHEGESYLRTVAGRLTGHPVEVAVRFGDPTAEIIEEAREVGADLIVIATHGRGGVARLLLGSVAAAVLRESQVPVVLVRHGLPAAA